MGRAQDRREEARPEEHITVMSFNIRYGTADDGPNNWRYRRELLFRVIREQAPDILGLQEALRFQLDELASALPEYSEAGVGRSDGATAGEYAAVLYLTGRFELLEEGTFWFSEAPDVPGSVGWGASLPRICTWVRLRDRRSDRGTFVYNVHFDHQSQESRARGARLLARRILRRSHPEPVIVTGDFNAGEDNPAMRYLLGAERPRPALELRDSFRMAHPRAAAVGTFNGFSGDSSGAKIDAVLVSPSWTVISAAIVRTMRDGRYPSDHFPVVATLRW